MIASDVHVEIDRPVSEVFAYVTAPPLLSSWQTNMASATQLSDDPIPPGSQLRESHLGPGGRKQVSIIEVLAVELDRLFALHNVEGRLPVDGRFTFTPIDRGPFLRLDARGQPQLLLRLTQPSGTLPAAAVRR